MRVLILSRDRSGLDPASITVGRWRLLRDQGVELDVLVMSSSTEGWSEKGIAVRGCGGGSVITRWLALHKAAMSHAANADLITAQDPFELGWVAWRSARRFGKPWELQDHGGFFDGKRPCEPFWNIRSRMAWFLMRRASRIRTVQPESGRNIEQRLLKKNVYHLPVGIDKRFASIVPRREPGLIVAIMQLAPVKQPLLLLEAFAILKQKNDRVKLVFVGQGPMREEITRHIHDLALDGYVGLVGWQDPETWLAKASAFAMTSTHEGWPRAPLEAALAGVPVVMTDTGCGRWLQERGLGVVVASTPQAVAEGMAQMLGKGPMDPKDRADILSFEAIALRQVEFWQETVAHKPRILVTIQAVDPDDALTGFFHRWLEEAAMSFSRITVLGLRVGRYQLPENVMVIPLRDKTSHSRMKAAWTLLKESFIRRKDYDGVFVRGDAQYAVLAGWLWRLLGKKVVLWYAHYTSKTKWLKPASWFCNTVVTSVPAACRLKQAVAIGQGVDATRFNQTRSHQGLISLLVFGRVSSIKRVPWILDAVRQVVPDAAKRLTVVGRATSVQEADLLKQAVASTGAVWEDRDVVNADAPALYLAHDVYLNATPGSLDKTIVEAMLCGLVVIASTPAYGSFLPDELKWLNPDDVNFGNSIARAAGLAPSERQAIGSHLRSVALEYHSQTQQIAKLAKLF